MNMVSGKTLCVILHYGSEDDTNKCIESLVHAKNCDVVISDNDPKQSYEPAKHIRGFVKLIKTGGVAGFSEGNNMGVKAFLKEDHDSVFILNNDTITMDGALDYLRETLFSSGVGAAGPCMPYASTPNRIWACGGYIKKRRLAVGGLQRKKQYPYEVDYLPGAAILCRSDIWVDIGGLSEAYFLAYEEAEFALEVRKRGFTVMVDPRAIILHKVGMSSQQKPEYYYNDVRNRLIFSRYLYGNRMGLGYGIVVTLASVRARTRKGVLQRIRLWARAVSDQIRGAPIDRKALQSVASRFGGY